MIIETEDISAVAYIKKVSSGEIRQYQTMIGKPDGYFDLYTWREGNYSCDCNRQIFFKDGEIPEDLQCSDGRYLVNLKVDGKIIYQEFEEKEKWE